MTLSIRVDDTDVQVLLGRLIVGLSPPALSEAFLGGIVEPYLISEAENRFASEGDEAVGGKWEPLTEATIRVREDLGYGGAHPINVRTGELKGHVTSGGESTPEAYGALLEFPGKAEGELATKMEHAQAGGISTSGKSFPARPVIALASGDLAVVLGMMEGYIYKVGGHGFTAKVGGTLQ